MNSAGTCKEGDVQARGHNLHYLEWGEDGEDIIYLHGLANFMWAHSFDPFCASLSGDHHIIAFDLLGHGGSDDPKKPIGYGEHADIIREGARELGLTKYVLWGYSFGGSISMFYADRYPEEVTKIILVDIAPETYIDPEPIDFDLDVPYSFADEEEALDWFISKIPSVKKEAVRPWIDTRFRRGSDGWLHLPSHSSRKENLRFSGDGWSVFSGLKMPVLLIRGSESHLTTGDRVSRMREVKPDLIVRTIQGADHGVPFTHSEKFMEVVREFLIE
jgi:pimeloyl-ACP methyl ester carboxylesterase